LSTSAATYLIYKAATIGFAETIAEVREDYKRREAQVKAWRERKQSEFGVFLDKVERYNKESAKKTNDETSSGPPKGLVAQLIARLEERKKELRARMEEIAKNEQNRKIEEAQGPKPRSIWPDADKIAERTKRIWNEDVEKAVRKIQKTDWNKIVDVMERGMQSAQRRIGASLGRITELPKKEQDGISKDEKKNGPA